MKSQNDMVIEILRKEKCLNAHVSTYMNHIIIDLPNGSNFNSAFRRAEDDIKTCLDEFFPQRNENMLFEVRMGDQEKSFKLYK